MTQLIIPESKRELTDVSPESSADSPNKMKHAKASSFSIGLNKMENDNEANLLIVKDQSSD